MITILAVSYLKGKISGTIKKCRLTRKRGRLHYDFYTKEMLPPKDIFQTPSMGKVLPPKSPVSAVAAAIMGKAVVL